MRYLLVFSLFLLFLACTGSQTPLLKGMPDAEYPKSHPIDNGFYDWLRIAFNNDSLRYGAANTSRTLHSLDELDRVLCEEYFIINHTTMNNIEDLDRSFRTLILEIDSNTRYGLVDQIVEFLKQKNLHKFYLRTRNPPNQVSGFVMVFSEVPELAQPYLVRMYGEKMNTRFKFYQDCLGEQPPPPPPGPPPPSRPTMRFINPLDSLKSAIKTGDFGKNILIEIQNGQLYLNKEPAAFERLIKAVQEPKGNYTFYIMLGEKNNYGDLIKIIDLFYSSRESLTNSIAQKLYNRNISELEGPEKSEVYHEAPFMWSIISLSEQLYLNE